MPNTFAGQPLHDPRFERANRRRFLRDHIPELEYANSFYVPSGRGPARGWLLLKRAALNEISGTGSSSGLYGVNFQLILDECVTGGRTLTLNNLAIVQSRCVSTGLSSSPDALYLVEITDRRGLLANQWYRQPTTTAGSFFNVRSPAYPELYYTGSLSGGSTVWTWETMVGNLWGQMSGILGANPGLPITPGGTPENWILPGVSVWEALNRILDHVGCTVAVDLQSALSPYTMVSKGTGDAALSALAAANINRKEDDLEWIDIGSGRVPGSVVVYFHRRNQYYGTEETVRRDTLQWETSSFYTVTVAAPFGGSAGTHFIWDDFTVRYDVDGAPLAADVATAASIATLRTNQYFNEIYNGTGGYMRQVYTGLVPFKTGSQADGVCWRQDFRPMQGTMKGQGQGKPSRLSWRTEIARGTHSLWPCLECR